MTKNYLTLKGRLGSMLFAMAALLLLGSTSARADVKVVIKDFNLSQNNTARVAVEIQQTAGETFNGLSGDIYLSEGLEFVDENGKQFGQSGYTGVLTTKNSDRCTNQHALTSAIRDGQMDGDHYAAGHGEAVDGAPLRVLLYSASLKNVKGTEGDVFYFYVKAVAPFKDNAKATITFEDAKVGSTAVSPVTATVYDENRFAGLMVQNFDIFESTELSQGEATGQIYLHWSDIPESEGGGVTGFSADLYLPEGLSFATDDDGDYIIDHALNTDHVIQAQDLSDGGVRVMVFSPSSAVINATGILNNRYKLPNGNYSWLNDYPVLNFKVIAADSLPGIMTIDVKNVKGITPAAGTILINNAQIQVTNLSANQISALDYSMNPGDEQEIGIELLNVSTNITSFQADVVLPAGLELVPDDEDDYFFMNADRVTQSHSLISSDVDGNKRVMLFSLESASFKGTSGNLVSFKVKAGEELADTSYIRLVNASIANNTGRKMTLPELDIMIINPNAVAVEEIADAIAELEAEFAAAAETVAQDYALAADAVAEDAAAIEAEIAALKEEIDEIVAAGEAVAKIDEINAKIEEIEEMINDYLEAAEAENDIAMRVMTPAIENGAEYYSLSGKRLTAPVNGQINIVKYNNGSVRKLYIE